MRKIILLIGILVGVPFCMKAQNEMYFLPESQKETKEKKEVKRETSQRNTVSTTPKDKVRKIYVPSGSTVVLHETEYNNDKIDQYNRRNQVLIAGDEEYEYVPPTRGGEWINHGFEGSMDDYGDAERAITSRDRRYSISISSPNYWDIVYGLNSWDWNIYVDDFDAYIFPKYTNRYWSSWKFGRTPRLSILVGMYNYNHGGWYDPFYYGGWGYYSSWGYPSWGWGHSWGGWYDPYYSYPSWGWGGGYYPYYGRRSKGYYTNRRYDGYSSYGRGSSASSSTRYRANSSSTRYNPTDRSVRRDYSSTRNRSTGTFINSGSNTSSSVRPVRTNRTNAVRYDNVQYNRGGNSNVRNSTRATDNRSTIRYTRPSSTRSNSTRNRTVYSNRNNSRDFNVNRSSSSSFNSSTRSSYSGGSSTRSSYSSGSTSSRSSNSSGSSTRSSGGSSSRTNATRR